MARANPNLRGTTLLELVIAAALLAIATVGFFRLYSIGIAAGEHAERLTIAVGLAGARMEQLISNPRMLKPWEATNETTSVTGYQVTTEVIEETAGLRRAATAVRWVWRGQPRQTTITAVIPDSTPP